MPRAASPRRGAFRSRIANRPSVSPYDSSTVPAGTAWHSPSSPVVGSDEESLFGMRVADGQRPSVRPRAKGSSATRRR
jgi:hypothetical protein